CVTYTVSASGRPLGSAVEHRGITDRAQGIPDLRAGGPVLAQAADPTLDAAGLEVWGALLNGGRLVAVTEDATENADVLAEQVQAGGINTLLVSADFAHRLAREAPDVAGRLKRLIVLGERPDRNALKRLSAAGGPRLYAAYGATETATITALRDCSGISSDDRPITMGRPVASNRWYVLDRSLRPVPRGGRGELHIGGEGVARGYFRAPALTAERFVPDPFGEPGSRLFRTGDLVLRRTDGELEFLGRIDRRTRIGGRGVDPASVEACLRASRMVSDAAVQIRSGPDGRRRLVGYVVPAAGSGLDAVREHLRRHLPPWLIPSAIIEMPAIPRTRRGTPEYGALPGPAWRAEPSRRDPATSSERRVHTAWRDVLEIPGVGVDENFFAVGGHSLSAVRVASRLSTDFGVPVTARLLFEHPTVAETAAALDELVRTKAPSGAEAAGDAPIKAVRRGGRSIADLLTDSAAARAPREPHPAETTDEGVDQRD
ncbi:MAG: AMP-binding protein, partial [Actinoallomurus sp.]